ncbi:MAG: RNA polymerase sigma factor [Solirubrobacterales bacterium]
MSVDRVFRRESGRAVATLVRRFGDLELAEESVQDAFVQAMERWPVDGIPDNPGAWVTTVAGNRALDVLRRSRTGAEKIAQLEAEPMVEEEFEDNRLRLVIMCCHPALAVEAQVALTLNLVAGLSTETIARAFLVPQPTMAKRLTRAKRKIRDARIPFNVPTEERELQDRVSAAQAVVYLVFNEGYAATDGDVPVRAELCDEAIWLARLLRILRPDDPDQAALLALLLLQDSRRETRVDEHGELVLLADQDRSRWDQRKINEGLALLSEVIESRQVGVYALQATIAAKHATAPSEAETDWLAIAETYARLGRMVGNPVLEVNRAIAVSMAWGPEEGLAVLDSIDDDRLAEYLPLHAARADLLARSGRTAEAAVAYRSAIALAENAAQRAQLERALATLGE